MGTAVWQDASTDWDDTDNWTGGDGMGGVPAIGDTIVIGSGTSDILSNLDTGLTGCTLRIGDGYSGTIGDGTASASTGHLDIDGATFDFEGSGAACYVTGTWTTVNVLGGTSTDNTLSFKANSSSDIGTLRVLGGSGTYTVGSNAVLDVIEMIGAESAELVIADSVTSLDTIVQDSGVLTCSANIATSAEVLGGKLELADSATCVLLRVRNDGLFVYTSSGAITTIEGWSGRFDATDNANASVTAPTTITTYEGFVMDLRNGLRTFADWTWSSEGGLVYPPVGTTVTIS